MNERLIYPAQLGLALSNGLPGLGGWWLLASITGIVVLWAYAVHLARRPSHD